MNQQEAFAQLRGKIAALRARGVNMTRMGKGSGVHRSTIDRFMAQPDGTLAFETVCKLWEYFEAIDAVSRSAEGRRALRLVGIFVPKTTNAPGEGVTPEAPITTTTQEKGTIHADRA